MNLATVRRVFEKELRETLRDRRTLLIMLVVPVFLYPVLLIVLEQLAIFGQRNLEEAPASVVAQGVDTELLRRLEADSALEVSISTDIDTQDVAEGEVDLLVALEPAGGPDGSSTVRLYFDASRDRSTRARDLVDDNLASWSDTLLARRLAERGLPGSFAQPLVVADTSVASPERMGGYALGRFLPLLLILMTLLGAFYPAIDLSAGEKERGTLETLLTTPVPASEIVMGKFLTVMLIALSAAVLNLASMLLTLRYAALQLTATADINFSLPWSTVLLVVLFLIPLAVFFSAIFLGMALRAQSFKEAQNTLTPVQLASMIPMMLPLVPGMPLSYAVALVPIGGVALLFRELMTGGAPFGPAAVALLSTVVYAGLALRFAANSFGREEVLFGSGGAPATPRRLSDQFALWRRQGHRLPRPGEALGLVALCGLLYFYLGVTLQIRFGQPGLLLSQVLLLALPAVAFVLLGPFRPTATLALRVPTPRALAAAVLIILGGVPVGWLIAWLQSLFMEIPEEFLSALEELIRADTGREVAWLLLLVAITPAICEELVFRGVLLHGLANGLDARRAILISAVIFGAFHLSVETAIRFLPSAWLGVLLGLVVWRTGSLLAGTMMHFINNALIVVLVALPSAEEYVVSPEGQPRWYLVVIGIPLLLAGLRLLPSSPASVDEPRESVT